ncbi:Ferredoxin II [Sedimentisphaera cyanobacteriorum]|uniref:Ferredoxin II n=1 Tax=Sedimentisphaera cyanobacteriorum TaxID=1940790 RepID=A0A1Q2HN42_9BACT|nr:4Fe-4S binding protein [Sedimentisphaera cyanobacteriorum]AQQ08711.1 Ferredoxin II [Sedimentisphaera cyanobacteriorum]
MSAAKTKIVIDEEKCIGCEQCVNVCQGGALEMVDGKAKLVREDYCDHLGRCIGKCPAGAITFEEAEAEVNNSEHPKNEPKSGGCPSMQNKRFSQNRPKNPSPSQTNSALDAWPIQLHLIRPDAEQFVNADVLIAASCTAFSFGSFHQFLLKGKSLAIACPKLDRTEGYEEKLTELFAAAEPRSVTIARMEVPCCSGLTALVEKARDAAGTGTVLREVTIGLEGELLGERYL